MLQTALHDECSISATVCRMVPVQYLIHKITGGVCLATVVEKARVSFHPHELFCMVKAACICEMKALQTLSRSFMLKPLFRLNGLKNTL